MTHNIFATVLLELYLNSRKGQDSWACLNWAKRKSQD